MKLYIDTNIYLDYFLERHNSKYAFKIFKNALKCKFYIIISDQVLYELNKNLDYRRTISFFQILKHKVIKVKTEEEDKVKAKQISTHYLDALHIVLAEKSGADIVITNNIKDFRLFFQTKRPEEF